MDTRDKPPAAVDEKNDESLKLVTRREFLRKAGAKAVLLSPAMIALLSSDAYAAPAAYSCGWYCHKNLSQEPVVPDQTAHGELREGDEDAFELVKDLDPNKR